MVSADSFLTPTMVEKRKLSTLDVDEVIEFLQRFRESMDEEEEKIEDDSDDLNEVFKWKLAFFTCL